MGQWHSQSSLRRISSWCSQSHVDRWQDRTVQLRNQDCLDCHTAWITCIIIPTSARILCQLLHIYLQKCYQLHLQNVTLQKMLQFPHTKGKNCPAVGVTHTHLQLFELTGGKRMQHNKQRKFEKKEASTNYTEHCLYRNIINNNAFHIPCMDQC